MCEDHGVDRRDRRWTEDAIPESVELRLQEPANLRADEKPEWNDYVEEASVPLGVLRARIQEGAAWVADEFGTRHPLDISRWNDDPDDVRIVASFSYQQRSVPRGLTATVYPNDLLDRIAP
jgi:hypothetical protein